MGGAERADPDLQREERSAGDRADDGDLGYAGPATVLIEVAGEVTEVAVRVDLRGVFQPIDGRFHWYGRVAANPELAELVSEDRTARARVVLRTPAGERPAELSDLDLWDRYRITGTGTPPFATD